MRAANARFLTGLIAVHAENDPFTANHSVAVATYSRDIAERMGLSDDERYLVFVSGLVHDIGKVKVPREIIEKPGPLTEEEARLIERHPAWGEELVRKVAIDDHDRIGKIVRHHHEWMDGRGYPDRLRGEEILLPARIIAVAEAYNTMTWDTPYRHAMSSDVARRCIVQESGSQFDPAVVAAFEEILAAADEAYLLARSPAFAFLS